MPDAISAAYNNVGEDEQYFALGPIPPDAFLLNLYGMYSAAGAGPVEVSHALTLQDAADAGAHAAGRRLCARSAVLYNTQPGYVVRGVINSNVTWSFTLNSAIPGGAAWIITRAQAAVGLAGWNMMLTVGWLNFDEYERLYGRKVPVTIIGAPVRMPPPFAPPGEPTEAEPL